MHKILSIPIQKLFVVALILKVVSSGIGWYIRDPRVFGAGIPLLVMVSYIIIGVKRDDNTVSDEKFADSCYYLGFIFTITSIIFSLFDLPNIGTQMSLIATRFGTAMASTVLGLAVRVYLVTFREDVEDAVQAAEEGVIDASHRLREQLTIILEKFRDFEAQVHDATSLSIAKVNVGVEELTRSYGQKLAQFFEQLSAENTKAFKASQTDVHEASLRLSRSVDGYANEMKKNLQSIEGRVVHFAEVVTRRLEKTTFPDDYFAQRLAEPLSQLGQSTTGIAETVTGAARDINQALETVRVTFAAMRAHAGDVESMFERVAQLTTTQETLLAGSQAQVDTLSTLNSTLHATQEGLGTMSRDVVSQKDVLASCARALTEQTSCMEGIVATLCSLDTSLSTATKDMHLQQAALATASKGAAEQTAAFGEVNHRITGLTDALGQVAVSIGQNSKDMLDLAQHVTDDSAKAQLTRTTTLDAAERIETATHELPLVKEAVQAMSEKLGGLLLEMRGFAAEVTALVTIVTTRETPEPDLPAGRFGGANGHANGHPNGSAIEAPVRRLEGGSPAVHQPVGDASRT